MLRRSSIVVALAVLLPLACVGCEPPSPAYPEAEQQQLDPASPEQPDAYADNDPSALTDFREALDPHGRWVDDPTYGTVWVPNAAEVGPDFAPYVTSGHWVNDDGEYVWISDYPWGWAPFHYGRWAYSDGIGWVWVPGRTYAGAWVVWRVGDDGYDYVGWAPMPPLWYWRGGVIVVVGAPPPAAFVFVPRAHVFAPNVYGHVMARDRAMEIGGRTHVFAAPGAAHGYTHPAGPSPSALGHDPAHVPHSTAADGGITRARAYGKPSSAAPLGARAPASRGGKPRAPGGGSHAPAPHRGRR